MIKNFIILLIFIYANEGLCGVSVLGTRFVMENNAQLLNIKISNDNESDYLIKSTSDDNSVIITPPLMLLKRNNSNFITIIPKEMKKTSSDKLINLTITAIPKSLDKSSDNSVSIAVRSHFKIIYRHKELNDSSFNKMELIIKNNHCMLVNNSKFIFTLSLSQHKSEKGNKLFSIRPEESVTLGDKNSAACNSWVNFYNEYNDIIKSVIPSRTK